MAKKSAEGSSITSIANAIRSVCGLSSSNRIVFPNGFVSAIENMVIEPIDAHMDISVEHKVAMTIPDPGFSRIYMFHGYPKSSLSSYEYGVVQAFQINMTADGSAVETTSAVIEDDYNGRKWHISVNENPCFMVNFNGGDITISIDTAVISGDCVFDGNYTVIVYGI